MSISAPLISSGDLAARLRDEDLLVCDCHGSRAMASDPARST
jgi:hypothetical protein